MDLNDHKEIYGKETGTLEVIHMFAKPLPYASFMPIVPVWWISAGYDHVPGIFRPYIARRTNTVVYENEFNVEPVMTFMSENYPSNNVVVTINFAAAKMPAREKIIGLRIKNHGVITLKPEYDEGAKKVVFRLRQLRNEKLRIAWPIPTTG